MTTDERDAVCKRYCVQVYQNGLNGTWYASAKGGIFYFSYPRITITPSEFENLVLTRVMEEIFAP